MADPIFRSNSRARIRFEESEPFHTTFLLVGFALTPTSEEVHESLLIVAIDGRLDRDAERFHAYFEALAHEVAGRKRRGKGAALVAEFLQTIAAEYGRRVRDLQAPEDRRHARGDASGEEIRLAAGRGARRE